MIPLALDLKRETLELVPIKFIFHYHLLPLGIEDDCLTLAFSEPPRQMEQGNLRLLLSKRFKIVLATPSAIHAVIKKNFGLGAETIQKLRDERGGAEIGQEIVFDVQGKETDSALEVHRLGLRGPDPAGSPAPPGDGHPPRALRQFHPPALPRGRHPGNGARPGGHAPFARRR